MAGASYKSFDHTKLDKIIHNRLRLAILSSLAQSEEVDFVSLRNAVKTSDGNLSAQIKLLQAANYVSVSKLIIKNKPQTNVALTIQGKNALIRYRTVIDGWLNVIT
jgi:DNA-binding transcriptional ArsR family regulator